MNKNYLAALCAATVMLGIGTVNAKETKMPAEGPKMERMQKMHDDMATRLNLTEVQKTKADKIRAEGRKKMQKLHKQMQKLRKENMAEFEKILTPEQKAQFEKIKAEHKPMGKHKGKKEMHRGPGMEHEDGGMMPPHAMEE